MVLGKKGIFTGVFAYIIWGFLPIYWKLLDHIGADIVLAHRIIWSLVFMVLLILFSRSWGRFIKECKQIMHNKMKLLLISSASIIISSNWLVFIWAVQNGFVVQSSLGYYINPLISIILGVLLLKERLSILQTISVILAGMGVSFLTWSYGIFPWVSFALAITFGLYGLLKKMANIDASFGLAIETLIATPLILIYLIYTHGFSLGFTSGAPMDNTLLALSGVATAIPLLLFGFSVLHIPLTMVGFLQYIAPTIMLILGVFFYDEAFTTAHMVTFLLIWFSLVLFMYASLTNRKKRIQKAS